MALGDKRVTGAGKKGSPVHSASEKALGKLGIKFDKRKGPSTAQKKKKKADLRAAQAKARTAGSNKKRASIQEGTWKLMGKGLSYDEARSAAEYGVNRRSAPAIPTIDKAMAQIVKKSKKPKKKVKKTKTAKKGSK